MSPTIRPLREDEVAALDLAMATAFLNDVQPDHREHLAATLELERTRCAFDGDQLVGTAGTYSLEMAVPGGTLPCGGTSYVTVRASHRRRGLLRAMMRALLEDGRERGEPLAALWASESSIYGRFGYGPGGERVQVKIDRVHARFAEPPGGPGTLRLVSSGEARKLLPAVYEGLWRERPGHFARSDTWWEHRRLADPAWDRMGATSYRYLVYEEAGAARGYLQYRVLARQGEVPSGEVWVAELNGLDAAARRALWAHALDHDLTATVRGWNQPADLELPWWLADPRRLHQQRSDGLWLRVLDVERALAGRGYAAEGSLRLGVRDRFCDWNEATFQLEAGPGGAACRRTDASAEIELDATALGALYLGGHRFQTLARAGLVGGAPQALARADALFAASPAPWCPEIF